jgi:hypothetical protein
MSEYKLTLFTSFGDVIDSTKIHANSHVEARKIARNILMYQGLTRYKFKLKKS